MAIKQIIEGWGNRLSPNKSPVVEAVAESRLNICRNCPHHSSKHNTRRPDEHCTKCGCTLLAKVRSMESHCPVNKW